MKIYPIQNIKFNNISYFQGHPTTYPENKNNKQPKINFKPSTPAQEFKRRLLIGILTASNIYGQPAIQDIFTPEEVKIEKRNKEEYFEKVSSINSPARTHLYQIVDIDNAEIKPKNNGYDIKLKLDKNESINFVVNMEEENPYNITGYIKDRGMFTIFNAMFSEDNPKEFILNLKNSQNQKITIGRNSNGELYKLENNKQIVIDSENVKLFHQKLQEAEQNENLRFFTNENKLWRILNYALLLYLLLNEIAYEELKKAYYKKQDNIDNQ